MNDNLFSQIDFGPLVEYLNNDDITDISFLQGLLSSGTGSEKPAETTEPTTQPETSELTTEAETTTNEVTQ